jgi:hypothetical protein
MCTRSQNRTYSVILHGGLGNQLFQWSYGHQLAVSGNPVQFTFYKRPYLLEHTNASLGKFLPNCMHGSFLERDLPNNRMGRLLLDPLHRWNFFSKALGRVLDTTGNPFIETNQFMHSNKTIHFGYFQTFYSVMTVESLILREIWGVLENRTRTQLENNLAGLEVIHVRQGDTLTLSNMKKVGVLSSKYYNQMPKKSATPRIVLTDDVEGAKRLLPQLNIQAFFGPSELDVYQTLGVMARSSTLFTANSTLSWWGGLLAHSRGAEVHIPDPFFRNFHPDPALSFAHPGFNLLKSQFM